MGCNGSDSPRMNEERNKWRRGVTALRQGGRREGGGSGGQRSWRKDGRGRGKGGYRNRGRLIGTKINWGFILSSVAGRHERMQRKQRALVA